MARAGYIYHIREIGDTTLLGSFTVKHEAHTWADRFSGHPREALQLSRARDGVHAEGKSEVLVPWDAK